MRTNKVVIILSLLVLPAFAALLFQHAYNSPASKVSSSLIINIKNGQTAVQIIDELTRNNLLRYPLVFRAAIRVKGIGRNLKAGEYEFNTTMSPKQIIDILERGAVKLYPVTLPEGLSFDEVTSLLASNGMVDYMEFQELGSSSSLLKEYGIKGVNVEGYLYPDTYYFNRGMSASRVMKTLLDRFFEVYKSLLKKPKDRQDLSLHELVTLASIVEKEAKLDEERPRIAQVFLNRLDRKMRLESCATVIFALGYHVNILTDVDLKTESPYNTYKNYGLPPGPICNPGAKSIAAALNPSGDNYLYFVSKEDGSHHFSKTFDEHNRAKRKIRRKNKARSKN